MSNLAYNSLRLYGGMPSGDPVVQLAAGTTNQNVTEVLPVATYRRRVAGPKVNSRWSFHIIADVAGGAGSVATIWYSNMPDPSLASDADWVQDTVVGNIDMTVAGGKMINVGNVDSEWVMLKVVVAVTPCSMRAFYRSEGTTHGKMG